MPDKVILDHKMPYWLKVYFKNFHFFMIFHLWPMFAFKIEKNENSQN